MSSPPPDPDVEDSTGAPVIVVGSVNADLVVTTRRLPGPGETVTGGAFARHWGGKGANQAVAAARFGATVELLGAVGDDELGVGATRALADAGVGTTCLRALEGSSTGVALIVVDDRGENQIAVAPGANARVEADGLADLMAAQEGPGVLLAGFEPPDAAIEVTLAAGRASRWRVVVNPAPARPLSDGFADSGALLTPNRGELTAIVDPDRTRDTGRTPQEVASLAGELARRTGGPVAVTLGPEGALVVDGEHTWRQRPPEVEVVDTTGAGDVFNGVLAAGLAEDRPLDQAVRTAVTAAALSTEAHGARGGTPTRPEVLERAPEPEP